MFKRTAASAKLRNKRKSRGVTLPSVVAIFASHGDTRSRWQICSPGNSTQAGDCPSSSFVGFNGTVASEKVRNKRKSGVGGLLSAVAIFASDIERKSRW